MSKKSAPAKAGALAALAVLRLRWLLALAGAAYEVHSGYSHQGYYGQDEGYDAQSPSSAVCSG